jgi:hypothetical protein
MNTLVRPFARTLVATIAILTTGFGVMPAEASTKYSFANGSMYTLEYADPSSPPFVQKATETRWGRIDSKGHVTALSDDLGLSQVTDADYSPETGLVYVLAEAYSHECELWSFDPDDPNGTLQMVSILERVGFDPAYCASLAINHNAGGLVAVALRDGTTGDFGVDYFLSDTGIYYDTDGAWFTEITAMDFEGPSALTINGDGAFRFFGTPREGDIKNKGVIYSVKFDDALTPWILQWGRSGVSVGKMMSAGSTVKWGSVLRDAHTNKRWFSDTLVFIPR